MESLIMITLLDFESEERKSCNYKRSTLLEKLDEEFKIDLLTNPKTHFYRIR
jgi:hypothetical protein